MPLYFEKRNPKKKFLKKITINLFLQAGQDSTQDVPKGCNKYPLLHSVHALGLKHFMQLFIVALHFMHFLLVSSIQTSKKTFLKHL